MTSTAPALLTRPELARYLRRSVSTVKRLERQGLPRYDVAGVLYSLEDVLAWLDTRKVGGSSGVEESRGFASASRIVGGSSRREREIRQWLEREPRKSTPRSSAAGAVVPLDPSRRSPSPTR